MSGGFAECIICPHDLTGCRLRDGGRHGKACDRWMGRVVDRERNGLHVPNDVAPAGAFPVLIEQEQQGVYDDAGDCERNRYMGASQREQQEYNKVKLMSGL